MFVKMTCKSPLRTLRAASNHDCEIKCNRFLVSYLYLHDKCSVLTSRAQATCASISPFLQLLSFLSLHSEILSENYFSLLFGGLVFVVECKLITVRGLSVESSVASGKLWLSSSIRVRQLSICYERDIV